jgi:hypothetical protein
VRGLNAGRKIRLAILSRTGNAHFAPCPSESEDFEFKLPLSPRKMRSRLVYVSEVPDLLHRHEHIEQRSERKGETEQNIPVEWAD